MLRAKQHIKAGWATTEGRSLAQAALAREEPLDALTIDMGGCPNSLMISPFFNAFLQAIFDQRGEAGLMQAKSIKWKAEFPFQLDLISDWVGHFEKLAS